MQGKLNYPDSLVSPLRQHVITALDAEKIARHLADGEVFKTDNTGEQSNFEAAEFEGRTIEEAGLHIEPQPNHANMYIHDIICLIFDLEQIG